MLSLVSLSVFPCGVHKDQNPNHKQFVENDILYSSENRNHRGWSQYLAKSMHHTHKLALTFDDGPHPETTPQLLDILKKYNVKATFFAVASRIETYPDIAKRIVAEGHILASHDYQHINSNSRTESEYEKSLEKSILVVRDFYPQRHAYYRFPYGAYGRTKEYHQFNVMRNVGKKLFNENCINFVFWDIDTADWVSNMLPKDISQTLHSHLFGGKAFDFEKVVTDGKVSYVKKEFTVEDPLGGGVVLMHDIHQRTIDGVKIFLESAKDKDIEFTTLDQIDEYRYYSKICELTSFN